MNLHRNIFILAFLLLMPHITFAQVRPSTNPSSVTDTVFPLMAWDYVNTEKVLYDMQQCGINVVAFVEPDFLDACHRYGIRGVIYDEELSGMIFSSYNASKANAVIERLIATYNSHPALYGYHLKDEPQTEEFPELAKSIDLIKKAAPGKWPYVNLFPTQIFGDNYESHIDQFGSTCQPTAYSYDNYVEDYVVEDGQKSFFWKNLEQIRDASLKYNLPFWNCILTAPHWDYTLVTEANLRIRIFASLVYGAKGLSYYKFISASLPILNAPDLGNFRGGPLDQFGERTPTWDLLRNMNRQIQNLGKTLLKLRSVEVYHFGSIPEGCRGVQDHCLLKNVPYGNFVAGDFVHEDGSSYVMIVNKSQEKSSPVMPELRDSTKKIKMVSAWKGELEDFNSYFWLAPGQGVLLKLE
jgi:hypothetical protein